MKKTFVIIDERDVWYKEAIAAGQRYGYEGRRITDSADLLPHMSGWLHTPRADKIHVGFIRPHATPDRLSKNQQVDFPRLALACNKVVQDYHQVHTYEDKIAQSQLFRDVGLHHRCPATFVLRSLNDALEIIEELPHIHTWVSKAAVGASSVNVRVLSREAMIKHCIEVFTKGVKVEHCDSKGTKSVQKDYVILQEFIPHTFTWRINRIGNAYAIFHRFNYKDKPVAQTGNVKPVITAPPSHSNDMFLAALDFAREVTLSIDTRWVALDILQHSGRFYLLETSLAWPWPSPGECNKAGFFTSDGEPVNGFSWQGEGPGGKGNMFDLMFDQIEKGLI